MYHNFWQPFISKVRHYTTIIFFDNLLRLSESHEKMSQDSYNLLLFFTGTSLFPDCEKSTKFSYRPAKILCLGGKCI